MEYTTDPAVSEVAAQAAHRAQIAAILAEQQQRHEQAMAERQCECDQAEVEDGLASPATASVQYRLSAVFAIALWLGLALWIAASCAVLAVVMHWWPLLSRIEAMMVGR